MYKQQSTLSLVDCWLTSDMIIGHQGPLALGQFLRGPRPKDLHNLISELGLHKPDSNLKNNPQNLQKYVAKNSQLNRRGMN
jgi:hypothetical protein